MPNNEIATLPEIVPFWETLQSAMNNNFRKLRIFGWEITNTMNTCLDDDKHRVN